MNLFAYGTLMWPEVLQAVIGRRLKGSRDVLYGYRRLRIRDACYPAIIPSETDRVEGVVYEGLTTADFKRLDRFEGDEYLRVTVGMKGAEAEVYVLSSTSLHLAEDQPWTAEQMHPEQLAAFCEEFKGWHDLDG